MFTKSLNVAIEVSSTTQTATAVAIVLHALLTEMKVTAAPACMGGQVKLNNGSQTQITVDMPSTMERTAMTEGEYAEYRSVDGKYTLMIERESEYWTPEGNYTALSSAEYFSFPGVDGVSEVGVKTTVNATEYSELSYYITAADISACISWTVGTSYSSTLPNTVLSGVKILVPRSDYTVEIKNGSQVQATVTVPRDFYQNYEGSFNRPDGAALSVLKDSRYFTAEESFSVRQNAHSNPGYISVDGVTAVQSDSVYSGKRIMILDAPAKDVSFNVRLDESETAAGMDADWARVLAGVKILVKPEGVASPLEAFVTRLYSICLDRAPGAAELSYYVNQLTAGTTTGVAVASNFVFSNEFKAKNLCDEHYVTYLYRVFFDRAPGASELTYHVNRLAGGAKREEVFNGFALSNEYKTLCQNYGITHGTGISVPSVGTVPTGACTVSGCSSVTEKIDAFIRRLYIDCLGRSTVAASEVAYYRAQLQSKAITGTQIAWNFFSSPEFTNQNLSSGEYVTRLYKVLMGRSPAATELSYHVNRLSYGARRIDIFNGFAMSAEFLNICNSYGIERGTAISG